MCGIAGIIDLKQRPLDRTLLKRICDRLSHRGPDDEGYYFNCHAALGQRRLSIIDLSTGRQPMSNEDGTIWVTFNGEIYNFQELRDALEERGHRFATHSDTEVIVHAYEQYGKECVTRFRGMFAFAIWDERRQELFLARDRVGKKPLFYADAAGHFIFASELQALVAHPAVVRELDPSAIDDFLTYGYIPAPKTPFRGVCKLLPAHSLSLRLRDAGRQGYEIKTERYWRLEYAPKLEVNEQDAAAGFLEVLTEAVRLRMISDVPLGALLSGGVDSSVVVAIMSGISSQPVKTFSIGFAEKAFNELPYARLVAQRFGTDHHEMVVRADGLEVLPKLVRHFGEPYADSSAIPSYHVAQLTRQHVTVALNGDGGDECFAGYDRYLAARLGDVYRKMPWLARKGLIEPVSALIPDSLPQRNRLWQVKRFLQAAALPISERYLRWMSYFTPAQKRELYSPEFLGQLGGYQGKEWLLGLLENGHPSCGDRLDGLLAADVESYLPYDLLVKMDIATMANSLEARSPFLDHRVMEFAAKLPIRYKRRRGTLKYLLKRIGKDLLPEANFSRRKMGFSVPVRAWIRNSLSKDLEDLLLGPEAFTANYLQRAKVRQLLKRHSAGMEDRSNQLWALLCLELWHREFLRA